MLKVSHPTYAKYVERHCEASPDDWGPIMMSTCYTGPDPISIKHFSNDPKKSAEAPTVEEAFESLQKLKNRAKIRKSV